MEVQGRLEITVHAFLDYMITHQQWRTVSVWRGSSNSTCVAVGDVKLLPITNQVR